MQKILDYYRAHQQAKRESAAALQSKSVKIAMLRLVYFIVWLALLILTVQWQPWMALILFYAGFLGFTALMRWHDGIQRAQTVDDRIATLCDDEVRLLDNDLSDRDTGTDLEPTGHAYAMDLDIFGVGSIFSLYSRCRTSMGRQRLADYLLEVVDGTIIEKRQMACQELEAMPEWMLRLQAEGFDIADTTAQYDSLTQWLDQQDHILGDKVLRWVSYILPVLTIVGFIALWYYFTFVISLLALIPAAIVLYKYKVYIDQQQAQIDRLGEILMGLSHMIRHMEHATFQDPYLLELRRAFVGEDPASKAIRRLAALINNLNLRSNIFGIVLNIFTLWDIHYMRRLEQWRKDHREAVPQWYHGIAEMEALVSVASVGFHHPDWAIPLVGDTTTLVGEAIGHPLLHVDVRVTNDYSSPSKHHIHLVTGSNMGGKSTFLRTVGLQIVLTYAGSRVCAGSWSMPADLQLYTSMRTQDAIQESTSGFYAELRRLQGLIDRVEAGQPTFYMLDEILKGTNSQDRNTGAAALIRQLLGHPSAGLISTHDTTLAVLEEELPGRLHNICFEVQVDGDQLTFDYTLKAGVSQSFNATQLMRQIGIKV